MHLAQMLLIKIYVSLYQVTNSFIWWLSCGCALRLEEFCCNIWAIWKGYNGITCVNKEVF